MMNLEDAYKVLGVEPGADEHLRHEAFSTQRRKLEEKLARAPTPGLAQKYRESITRMEEAIEVIELAADGGDLPALRPDFDGQVESPAGIVDAAGVDEKTPPKRKKVAQSGGHGKEILVAVVLVLLMCCAGAGWWFGIENPKREMAARLVQQGMVHEESESWGEAAEVYAEALSLKPTWKEALDGEKRVKVALDKVEADNVRALADRQRKIDGLLASARLMQSQEEWENALEGFEKVLDLDENHSEASTARDSLKSLLATARGAVVVKTEPGGATVRLSGKGEELSPANYVDLKLGRYEVVIEKKGYDPVTQTAVVRKDDTTMMGPVRLNRSEGAVLVKSTPEGMSYSLSQVTSDVKSDREFEPRSGQTPGVEADLPTGEYEVVMKRSGWPDYHEKVVVERDKKEEITSRFSQGTLKLTSDPAGADVINSLGEVLGKTPYETVVPTGEHVLSLRKQRFKKSEVRVMVKADEVGSKFVSLEKTPYPTGDGTYTNTIGMKFVPAGGDKVLFSVYETRLKDFEAFVKETGYDATGGMYSLDIKNGRKGLNQVGRTWKSPGHAQTGDHAVCGVSWIDARAFCKWLTSRELGLGKIREGQMYRLSFDHEWSVAVGLNEEASATIKSKNAEIEDQYPFGNYWPPKSDDGNYAGSEAVVGGSWPSWSDPIEGHVDAHARVAPVGSYKANKYGLYDMGGNVAEWCEETFNDESPDRVVRGSSWYSSAQWWYWSSTRSFHIPDSRWSTIGFRCVLDCGAGD